MVIKELENLRKDNSEKLEMDVLDELIEDYSDLGEVKSYIDDVFKQGCVSGICGRLVYYKDTNKFYDDFEDEIESHLESYQDDCGYNNRLEAISNLNGAGDVGNISQEKNLLAWFGYEQTIRGISDKLGFEL